MKFNIDVSQDIESDYPTKKRGHLLQSVTKKKSVDNGNGASLTKFLWQWCGSEVRKLWTETGTGSQKGKNLYSSIFLY